MPDITIKDVAKLVNVSIATVSRVINHDPSVRPDTLEKVNRAIKELHYVPNAPARMLKSDKTNIIGLLISDISNSHFTAMAKAMETILHKKGYSVVVCNTDDDAIQELEYLNRLVSLRVDGLILNTTNCNNKYIAELSHLIPIVLIDRNISDSEFIGDIISSNNFAGIQAITQQLIDCGHRKIGIINANLKVSTGLERLNGFVSTMRDVGIKVDEQYSYRYDSDFFNTEGGFLGCKYLMELKDRPSAIVVTNNTMSLGVYKYLRTNNFSVPEDVSVLSYGNIENSELYFVKPGYSTLNPYFIGERAANHLLSRIKQPNTGNREVIFEPTLVLNNSVRNL